jgi:Flp pilus assembly protein TadG
MRLTMMNTNRHSPLKSKSRGQSFIELALTFTVLMLILGGVVEYGFVLNYYLDLLDGARESARFSSNGVPFYVDPATGVIDYSTLNLTFFTSTADLAIDVISPITLDPTTDDIVISVFSKASGVVTRYPATGWQLYVNHTSQFSNAQVEGRLSAVAPDTGLLLVEIFYDYHLVLQIPFMTQFLGDPITVSSYAFMPLTAAEPTPTPKPSP